MNAEMECMCLECGVAPVLLYSDLVLESIEGTANKRVTNILCPECGGTLMLIGAAGDEPNYRTG